MFSVQSTATPLLNKSYYKSNKLELTSICGIQQHIPSGHYNRLYAKHWPPTYLACQSQSLQRLNTSHECNKIPLSFTRRFRHSSFPLKDANCAGVDPSKSSTFVSANLKMRELNIGEN